jgi:bifunctional non-homologous end joining protein LigD
LLGGQANWFLEPRRTFSERIEADGALVFAPACKLGLEGIMSKRLGGVYSSGRCRNWLKVKNPDFQR